MELLDQRQRTTHVPSISAVQSNHRLLHVRARRLQRATLVTAVVVLLMLCAVTAALLWWLVRSPQPTIGDAGDRGSVGVGCRRAVVRSQCSDAAHEATVEPHSGCSIESGQVVLPPSLTCKELGWQPLRADSGNGSASSAPSLDDSPVVVHRVVHATLYNGEADLLQIKLYELFDVVDVFVVVESFYTFRGAAKPLRRGASFHVDDARWAPFRAKLHPLMVDFDPHAARYHPWLGERTVRAVLHRYLIQTVLRPGDVVFTTDVDEIASRDVVQCIRTCRVPWGADGLRCGSSLRVHLSMHYYEFGLTPTGTMGTRWPIVVHRVSVASLQRARRVLARSDDEDDDAAAANKDRVAWGRRGRDPHQRGWTDPLLDVDAELLPSVDDGNRTAADGVRSTNMASMAARLGGGDAAACNPGRDAVAAGRVGWHISWGFQHTAMFQDKLASFSHTEFDATGGKGGIRSPQWIRDAVCAGRDILRRTEHNVFGGLQRQPPQPLPRWMHDHPTSMRYLRPWRCRQRGGAPS